MEEMAILIVRTLETGAAGGRTSAAAGWLDPRKLFANEMTFLPSL